MFTFRNVRILFAAALLAAIFCLAGCSTAAQAVPQPAETSRSAEATPETAAPAPTSTPAPTATPEPTPAAIVPTSVTLDQEGGILNRGMTWTLRATVLPEDAADKLLLLDMETASLVYENLLSNARRFAQSRVEIRIFLSGNLLLFSVSDDGPGFSSEALKRATEPFFRGEKASGGLHMGLGLNICKILCRRHGGDITVANRAQGGAEVTAGFAVS